jgi:tetratricopeptide (TPR) repeat protein
MDVVDTIAALPTGPDGPFPTDVTDPLVAITSMARVVDQIYPTLSADERHAALQQDIETAVAAGDNDEAADLLGAYRAACGEFGPELLYTEANVLAAVGRNAAAVETLGEYLRVADNTSETYLEALSLSRTLDPGAVEEASADEQRLAELAEDCVLPSQPTIPDANSAVMEDMVATQGSVVAYMEASNTLLECLEEIAEDDDVEEDDQELAVDAYNTEVETQEALAEEWNTQRQLFLSLQ